MALGSTQSPSENEYQEHFLGVKAAVREADNLTNFTCQMSWKYGSLNLLEPSEPHRACYGTPLPIYIYIYSNFIYYIYLLYIFYIYI